MSFWDKVEVKEKEDCWNWKLGISYKGYGLVTFKGKKQSAHRLSWKLINGEIEEGMQILHRCDNRLCCNPDHLFLGTNQDNMDDKVAKNRQYKKIDAETVIAIRSDNRTQREIAKTYGVSQCYVSDIKNYRRWKHI